ncbi:P-loop containing nucleoside triphosphate hydrolase protein [Xylariaceae sp. FL0662B]|nr:P-loop containing nucleoside triphosphate hydrolase protein [Xylariaceae sp. FL0662B]
MDYRAIHGQDISSFDLTSTHRLPTISAAQALEDIRTDPLRFISTSLEGLDKALNDVSSDDINTSSPRPGGFQKGQVIEIWGPPGSGKTSFGMQLAANALCRGDKVVWVDGFHPVPSQRLRAMIAAARNSSSATATARPESERTDNLLHFKTPTLAHFISLLCRPTTKSIPNDTSLIVVDGLSALVNYAFPRNFETRKTAKGPGPSARRLQVLQSVISAVQKLAATRDLIIVILSQCATRMQAEQRAALTPAINASTWEQGIATRLVLFRDWAMKNDTIHDVHFAGIQKRNGKVIPGGIDPIFAFDIQNDCLVDVQLDGSQLPQLPLSLSSNADAKRKLDQTGFEIADSEGEEDYGWEEDDVQEMPGMPPQWQGSEDILLGQDVETRTDDDSESRSVQLEETRRAEQVDSEVSPKSGNGSN